MTGCKHENTFYLSGGFRGPLRGHVDLVWHYNKAEDVWEKRASMITARSYHAMASAGDSIIVAGGVKYLGGNDFADILASSRIKFFLTLAIKLIVKMHL